MHIDSLKDELLLVEVSGLMVLVFLCMECVLACRLAVMLQKVHGDVIKMSPPHPSRTYTF
jgi:hypothetical protein